MMVARDKKSCGILAALWNFELNVLLDGAYVLVFGMMHWIKSHLFIKNHPEFIPKQCESQKRHFFMTSANIKTISVAPGVPKSPMWIISALNLLCQSHLIVSEIFYRISENLEQSGSYQNQWCVKIMNVCRKYFSANGPSGLPTEGS